MINSDNFLLTSGVILTILISATVISYTSKFIFVSDKLKKPTNQMYDPDQSLNFSNICIFSKDAYKTIYEKSPCFNKTLVQWYNPWLRHNLWTEFWNKIKARNRMERLKLIETKAANDSETPTPTETVLLAELPSEKENPGVEKVKERPIEFVYSILVGLLILSGVVACWEVCKDKLKKNEGAAAKAQERQCSLADFTINRHLRRESQQQTLSHLPRQGSLELTAKVTQNLIHQSSLDRAFPKTISEGEPAIRPQFIPEGSSKIMSLESRRNSMPLYLSNDTTTGCAVGVPPSPVIKATKRQSLDTSGEEMGPDQRKKSRHFIRRH